MANELTKKEAGFVKDYVETGHGTNSALNNYDTTDYSTAGNIASENLKKPKIQNAIKSIAESISDEDLVRVHTEGLQAVSGSGDNTQIDFSVRHKYLDSAYKLKGSYAAEKKEVSVQGKVEMTPAALALAQEYEEKLKNSIG